MTDPDFHLGPHQASRSDLVPRSPSRGASERASTDGGHSHDGLLSENAPEDNSARMPGDSFPDAPPVRQVVPAENPTQATNRPLGE